MIDGLLDILKDIRIPPAPSENFVVEEISKRLTGAGISFEREVWVAKRSRVDFMLEDGVVIEVKRGKPNSKTVAAQLKKYAASVNVSEIILVSERGLVWHIEESNGKRVHYVSLARNWGLTI